MTMGDYCRDVCRCAYVGCSTFRFPFTRTLAVCIGSPIGPNSRVGILPTLPAFLAGDVLLFLFCCSIWAVVYPHTLSLCRSRMHGIVKPKPGTGRVDGRGGRRDGGKGGTEWRRGASVCPSRIQTLGLAISQSFVSRHLFSTTAGLPALLLLARKILCGISAGRG